MFYVIVNNYLDFIFLVEPIVIPQKMVEEAPIGAMVRLVCNVEAWPRPLVTWFLDDAQLFDSNRFATVNLIKVVGI